MLFCDSPGMIAGAVRRVWISLALAGCGGDDLELPPLVASSKYIAYHTDADASVICMDDILAREDAFIERTAALLGVDPPDTIDFLWDPVQDGTEAWACPPLADCYKSSDDGLSLVVSRKWPHHHELVHAVDLQGLGLTGHPALTEGIAEYLGSLSPTNPATEEWPAEFKAIFSEFPTASTYGKVMRFVGAIFERHGAAKYRELRAKMPEYAGLVEFSEVFAEVYGQSLDDALEDMVGERVLGQDVFPGCDDAQTLEWTDDGLLERTIAGECGDPWFYGPGGVPGQASFYGRYIVEVPEAGYYDLTVGAVAGGPAPLRGLLTLCTWADASSGVASLDGKMGHALLQAGRHSLAIGFPPRSEARGEATVRLEYVGPPV